MMLAITSAGGLLERVVGFHVRWHQPPQGMLPTTDLPVADIRHRLGFSHPSQFTRAFFRQAGCSPSAYRDQMRR
jgi:AraC-like DNA-binding protein